MQQRREAFKNKKKMVLEETEEDEDYFGDPKAKKVEKKAKKVEVEEVDLDDEDGNCQARDTIL